MVMITTVIMKIIGDKCRHG